MRTETLNYQRLNELGKNLNRGKESILLKNLFNTGNLVLLPTAFLLGRASLVGGMLPFGVAVYAATMGLSYNRLFLAFAVLIGMVSGGGWEQIYITGAAMLLFNVFILPFRNQRLRLSFTYGIAGFMSVFIPQMVMVYLQGFLLYDMLIALFHAFIVFALTFIFRTATCLINDINKRQVFTNEETISLCIIAALALSGIGDIQLLGIGIKNMLSILLIMTFSFKCGAGVGAAVGISVGLIISMSSTYTPLVIGCYGFCGLLAGTLRNLGKMGTCLGFVMGNIVLTLYINGSTDPFIYLKEIIAAIVVFMVVPQKYIDMVTGKFRKDVDTCMDKRSYSMRIKEMTIEKLNKFSRAFKELSKTFNEISETKVITDKQDISALFDRVADRVCKDCSLCMHCWDRNFYDTYQVMFRIVERLEEKGRIESCDIPDYFMDRCERLNDFVDSVNNIYEIFKVDMVWKSKIGESRGLVSQQLEGLSRVISNLATEIDLNVHFKSDLEDIIIMELNKAGVKANEAMVFENKCGKYEISVFHKGCGGKRVCSATIEKLVSEVVGRKMTRENSECHAGLKGKSCVLKLVEEESYKVITGVAKAAKHDIKVSGDSYTFMNSGDGKFILALSDGMGSGQRAATQSQAAINMLEQFIESGFDKDTAIKLINSILVLKSSDDSFATIDLSVVDLYDGQVEFVKIGAIPTYIKKEDRVDIVKSVSLPAGILSHIDTEMVKKKVDSGDFVIMMSDGILDAFKKQEEGENKLHDFIKNINSKNPQEIADNILEEAKENCDGKPIDDMMVVVAKIWKRAA